MRLPTFMARQAYDLNMAGTCSFGKMGERAATKALGDGRILGLLAEQFLDHEFENLTRLNDDSKSDLYDNVLDGVWEAKSFKSISSAGTSCTIAKSDMRGKGRTYNHELQIKYLESLVGVIIIDRAYWPHLRIIGFRTEDILGTMVSGKKRITKNVLTNSGSIPRLFFNEAWDKSKVIEL